MTDEPSGLPTTIPGAAKAAAEKWPGAPGLIVGERRWTFAQVWADARAAASALLASGIGPGDRIAIWAPNSREWILAALGAQTLGAIIVPMNTRFKGTEAGDILRRAHVRMLFAPRDFLGQDYASLIAGEDLPDLEEIVPVDGDWDAFVARGRGADDPAVDAALAALTGDHISDIIFTSGTTGKPKGVLTAHGQAVRIFAEWARITDLRAGDRYLIANPFFHTFGYKSGWAVCFTQGATIVPMPVFDVTEVARQIEQNRISFLPGPPTIYQSLLRDLDEGNRHDYTSLRVAVTGAAPVAPTLMERMRTVLGIRNVVNGYGMTECGCIAVTRQSDDLETVTNSCGAPLPGLEVRCVDDQGNDLPPDTPGELLVRGYAVMKGYLDDPVATAETIDSDGWLHTGDVGTIDERGYLRITDRKKDMFISGGFNVYPAEVENLLLTHPAISMAAVVGMPDERMGEVGRAFVTIRPSANATEEELLQWARANMANYKVPRAISIVSDLPRNAAGKVLKIALRKH